MTTILSNLQSSSTVIVQRAGIQDVLLKIVLRCLKHLESGAQAPQPFSGYWLDARRYKPDAELTVMLFDQLRQEVCLGAIDVDEEGNEIWIDEYGRELEGITMWAELPYPEKENSPTPTPARNSGTGLFQEK